MYEVKNSEVVYDGALSRVRLDVVAMPGGDDATREVVEHLDAVALVALDDSGRVLLLRQYRHPVGDYLWELPAGMLDVDDEPPADAARRELIEEAGVAADELTELLTFRNSAGWNDERTTIYLATGLREQAPSGDFAAVDEEADLELHRVPFAEALAKVNRGEVVDAKTVIGLLLAHARGFAGV